MKIIDKLNKKQDMYNSPPVTIAFIGDSITQGCFEVYFKNQTDIETVYEYANAFPTRFREMLALLYPNVQVNVINSGVSGDNVQGGLKRLQRDVLKYEPDLVVVGFGANDCGAGEKGVELYGKNLREMFQKIKATGAEVIYIMEGPLCVSTSPHITDDRFIPLAESFSRLENTGVLQSYFERGREVAAEEGVKVCDIYSTWKKLQDGGVDITELLANKLNHPIRELHYYIATKIVETILFT